MIVFTVGSILSVTPRVKLSKLYYNLLFFKMLLSLVAYLLCCLCLFICSIFLQRLLLMFYETETKLKYVPDTMEITQSAQSSLTKGTKMHQLKCTWLKDGMTSKDLTNLKKEISWSFNFLILLRSWS
jgi:hypothetical protein